ncbi:hypothetical protein EMCRGX_G029899 [Ephydatia muelleri]
MNEDSLICADSSSENRSGIWSVSSHEPSSSSDILFLSSSSCGDGEKTTRTSPFIFLDATPPSSIHCVNDAPPIICSTPKTCCPKQCLQQHLEQAADINSSFQRRNQCDQTQFLLDMFHVTKGGSTHLVNGEKTNLFSKCDLCTKYTEERAKGGRDKKSIEDLRAKYDKHLEHVQKERGVYYNHRHKARNNPNKYLTIIIDGMDQSKTNVPFVCQRTKSTQNLWRLQSHITGVLIHTDSSWGKQVLAFVDLYQYPHDSNLTINILIRTLNELEKPLPPVLYLQLDNCFRENKNKFVMAFCALLVKFKFFSKVRINFLPVGHTHEDVDQFFSRISEGLRKNGAETFYELQSVITKSFTPNPKAILVEHLLDVKNWMIPHIQEIHGHTEPHCFRFTQSHCGENIVMHYRQWSGQAWIPETGIQILTSIPINNLQFCEPSFEKLDLPRLQQDLPKWRDWLKPHSNIEWQEFFSIELPRLSHFNQNEQSLSIQDILICRPLDPNMVQTEHTEANLLLFEMFEAEESQPHVSS